MIEKPGISDEKIIVALEKNYSIQASEIEFLPIGNDATAFSYHVETKNGNLYFLKLKTKLSSLGSLFAPRFLKDRGIKQVVAPLFTKTQNLLAEMNEFSIILYPFITGNEAMKVGMTDSQWTEFGSVLKQIHTTELPSEISQYVKPETFIPKWSELARMFHRQVNHATLKTHIKKNLRISGRKTMKRFELLLSEPK